MVNKKVFKVMVHKIKAELLFKESNSKENIHKICMK